MAVIKLSPFSTGISGVMKNLSFSTDGGTTIMKERETPANPQSPKQTTNRIYFSLSSKGYGTLSPSNLVLWRNYAKGQTFIGRKGKKAYTPNAFEAYKHLTQVWYAANAGVGTPPVAPPTTAFQPPQITVVAAATAGRVNFHGSADTPAGYVAEFSLQPLKNANRTPSKEGYRIVGYAPFEIGDGDDVSFPVAPGVFAARVAFIEKASGRRSEYVYLPVTGVALGLEQGGAEGAAKPAAKKKAA